MWVCLSNNSSNEESSLWDDLKKKKKGWELKQNILKDLIPVGFAWCKSPELQPLTLRHTDGASKFLMYWNWASDYLSSQNDFKWHNSKSAKLKVRKSES